jgi:hypothetical protein
MSTKGIEAVVFDFAGVLFDHRPNVEAARVLGWQAVHFTGAPALSADLARLGLLGD